MLAIPSATFMVQVSCDPSSESRVADVPDPPHVASTQPTLAGLVMQVHNEILGSPGDPSVWAHWALLMLANDFVDEAEEALRAMRERQPEDARWFYWSARHAVNFGDPTEAAQHLDRALELRPTSLPTLWERANLHLKADEKDAAKNCFRRMVDLDPEDPYGCLGLARLCILEEDWTNAEEILDQVISTSPEFSPAYFLISKIYAKSGRVELAASANEHGQNAERFSEPESAWKDELYEHCFRPYSLEIRATLLGFQNRWKEAKALLERAVEIDPERAGVSFQLGRVHLALLEREACLDAFTQALALQPDYREVFPELARACAIFGRPEILESALRAGLKELPDYEYLHYQMGLLLLGLDRPTEAMSYFRRATDLDPDDERIWRDYAESARKADRIDQFLFAMDGLAERFSERASIRSLCGKAWIQLGEWDRVDLLFDRYGQEEGDWRGESRTKEASQAVAQGHLWQGYCGLRQVLEANPDDATALYNLGNFQCRYGAAEKGQQLFERLLRLTSKSEDPRQEVVAALALARASIELNEFARTKEVLALAQARILENSNLLQSYQEKHDKLAMNRLEKMANER